MSTPTNWSDYYAPPGAAMGAIIFPYRLFVKKSAEQLGQTPQRMTILQGMKGGIRAAPSLGFTVGLQMISQEKIEKFIHRGEGQPSLIEICATAALVGIISTPPLAAFNGLTMGQSVIESLKKLNFKQSGAIAVREACFLAGLRASQPVASKMKKHCGDNLFIEIVSVFASGMIGSLIGHPADTALTRWQKNLTIENYMQLMRGAPAKGMGVGIFAIIYNLAVKIFS